MTNREAHRRKRDPVIIGEFAYRMRKVRRGLIVCRATIGTMIGVGTLVLLFMSELARIVTMMSMFFAATVVMLVTIPFINSNYKCPACGEPPILPRAWESGIELRVKACERCGMALE